MRSFAGTLWPIILAAFALAGCGREAPKCGDPATLELVKRIIVDQLWEDHKKGFKLSELAAQLELINPKAEAYQEKIKRWECSATLKVGASVRYPLVYQSQIDDSGQHLVGVGDINPFVISAIGSAATRTAEEQR